MNIEYLILIFLLGMAAQLVDGTLGMGYGVTSATLLISIGIHPAIASASVHAAEVVISFFSGVSHWRMGNVRRSLWLPLASLGIIGGALGAYGVVSLPVVPVRVVVGIVLLLMGGLIIYRFAARDGSILINPITRRPRAPGRLAGLGFFAAFIDALGGGGWGPICTPSLLISGEEPRYVIGSVNLAEFFVTVATTLTFIILLGVEQFRWDIVAILLLSGMISAPLAAWLCTRIPRRVLGILIGLLIVLLSTRTVVSALVGAT